MDYLIIIAVLGLGGWAEWRFCQFEKRLEMSASPVPLPKPPAQERLFPCYYCGHLYPVTQRERIGQYDYCTEHGSKRKSAHLELYTKPEIQHDRTLRIHPADRGSELSHNEPLPWVG